MRLRRLLCVLLCLPLSSLIVFSGAHIKASAAYSGGRYLTPNESLSVFGSVIPFRFFNGSGFTDGTFTYNSTVTITTPSVHSASGSFTYEGTTYLEYRAYANGLNTNPSYITVDIQPTYSIFDTSQIHSVIALSDGNSTSKYLSASTYQSPAWDWMYDGIHYHLENSDESAAGSGYFAYLTHSGRNFTYVCADISSQALASGYSYRATFSGNTIPSGSYYRLLIGVPYVDSDSSAAAGTSVSGGGSSGDTNINVSVDMSETNEKLDESNGFLSSIVSWISDFFSDLGSFVVGLFMPSEGFIDNWKEDLAGEIADTFSPLDTVDDTMDRLKQAFDIAGEGSINAIEFPAISIPGTTFSTSSISVPLRPMTDSNIYDKIAKFIDILATIAVFNMLLNKFKAFLVGEKVVEVQDVD